MTQHEYQAAQTLIAERIRLLNNAAGELLITSGASEEMLGLLSLEARQISNSLDYLRAQRRKMPRPPVQNPLPSSITPISAHGVRRFPREKRNA